jgi:hypothetical protein
MNEHLRQIAEQAEFEVELIGDNHHISFGMISEDVEPNLQKFAELIVRECVGIITDPTNMDRHNFQTADLIKEHFGVK